MSQILKILLGSALACAFFSAWITPAAARWETDRAAKVKAAYLYNFTRFVEWPEEAIGDQFVIGVVGEHPFGSYLEKLTTKQAAGKSIVIRHLKYGDNLEGCNIVFLGPEKRAAVNAAMGAASGFPMLLVSEMDGFAAFGGVIELILAKGKVRMKVNLDTARDRKLTLSSKLLAAAEIIGN